MQFNLFGIEETIDGELCERMADMNYLSEVDFENSYEIIIEIDANARRDIPLTKTEQRIENTLRGRR